MRTSVNIQGGFLEVSGIENSMCVRRLRLSEVIAMRLHRLTFLLVLIVLTRLSVSGQSNSNSPLKLSTRNPDGWFTLRVPKIMGKVERPADVDGGFYIADAFEIHYDYWTYENTPNWLRGSYAKSVILACPEKSRRTRTLRTRIDGKRAIIQRCSETDERKGFRHIYYVTFPKLRVFNGEYFTDGMFNFTVEYRSQRYLPVAEDIVQSLDFQK
jgi:hypothetical protein